MAEDHPSHIGEYEIVRRLGSGIMGDVFMASGGTNVYYAVKVVKTRVAQRLGSAQLFVKEIVSDNILQWRSIEESEKGIVFVSDYLEVKPATRRTLRTVLSDEILEMYAVLADNVAVLHGHDVLHGNIKTSNILVRRPSPREVMGILSDCGIGYVYNSTDWDEDMVRNGFAYMAPEKIKELLNPEQTMGQVGPAADIYSLTASLVESLSGREIYREASTPEEMIKLKGEKKFRLLNVNHPVKHVEIKALNELIANNLETDAGKRVPSMKEFAERLRACKVEKEELVGAL